MIKRNTFIVNEMKERKHTYWDGFQILFKLFRSIDIVYFLFLR